MEIYSFYESSFPTHAVEPIRQPKIQTKSKQSKKTNSVKTRYTSSETTNRNSSSTKSSRRSSNIPKIVRQSERNSNNNSLVRDVTTPDKFIQINQKNSSSTKKSTIKSFRPGSSSIRYGHGNSITDSSSKKKFYPEINSRKESSSKYKMP